MVNNASYVGTSNLDDKKANKLFYNEDYENLNLRNTIYFTNKLSSLLIKSKKASVINICSIYSFLGYDYNLYRGTKMRAPIAYGVSKAAEAAIVRNLEEWRSHSLEEKRKRYNSAREVLKHNFEVFKNSRGRFEKETVGVLSQLSSHNVEIH